MYASCFCGDPAAVKEKGLYRSCDVLLLDIEMPALSGLDLAAAINKQRGGSEKPSGGTGCAYRRHLKTAAWQKRRILPFLPRAC